MSKNVFLWRDAPAAMARTVEATRRRSGMPSPMLGDRRWQAAMLIMGLVGLVVSGYLVGRNHPVVHEESVGCLSAQGVISCRLADGSSISVSRDVPWTGVDGASRDHGRPDCLPPTGIGEEGPVRISWVEAEVDGAGRRSVVQVDCRG